MKFLVMAYYDVDAWENTPREEVRAITSQCPPLDAALHASGNLLEIARLGALKDAVSLRPRGGKTVVTDGPYMETKEQFGSFFLIEAADMAEAIRVASMHPAAQIGEPLGWGLEIRPIDFLKVPGA